MRAGLQNEKGNRISLDGSRRVFQNPAALMNSKFIPALLLAVACDSTGHSATDLPTAPRRPSIIYILADDLGYGDLSCYGQAKFATPNLDKMSSEGIRFTSAYAGSTVCSPSRAALMLGQHTGHLNLRGNFTGATLRADEVTVAEVLQKAGYRTCLIGKWGLTEAGLSGLPQRKGFDEFTGYLSNLEAHDYYPEFLWRFDPPGPGKEGFDGKRRLLENAEGRRGLYVPDLCTRAALNFLRYTKPEPFNHFRPFFLFLSYTIPHANNEEARRSGNGMQVPSDTPYTREDWPQAEKNKATMIARMDADIGRLFARLKELKMDENTVVIFSSDNGPHKEGGVDPKFFQSSGPFRGHKRDLTEGGIRVPLIVRWPAKIKPGQVSDWLCANWDFFPTAADLAMTQTPAGLDGVSLYPLLTGQAPTNRHDYLYWEFHERGFQQAVRMGDWKAIRPHAGEKLELYDLKTDPGEMKNVAEQNPEVLAKLESIFKAARTDSDRWPMKKLEKAEKPK